MGVLQKGLSFLQASQTYTLLTIGDGLVSQVPALVVSVASGMLISKTSSKGTADRAFSDQMSAYPIALGASAFFVFLLGLLPGMPTINFLVISAAVGFVSLRLVKQKREPVKTVVEQHSQESAETVEKTMPDMLQMDEIKLELGVGLVSLIKDSSLLVGRIRRMREDLAARFGVVVPTIRIVDNLSLDTYGYAIKIKEISAATGRLYLDKLLALDPQGKLEAIEGEIGKEPVLGLKGIWIEPTQEKTAKEKGYLVADPKALLITHLSETVQSFCQTC